MTINHTHEPTPTRPLRMWPAVVIAIVQLLVMFGAPVVAPDAGPIGMLGGVVGALAILVWWLFFSRARWFERVGAIALMVVAIWAARGSVTPAAARAAEKTAPAAPAAMDTPAEWPGFRGPGRDSVVHGVRIETDWTKSPPVLIWRRPVGPGWSSFAVHSDFLYTQEQRGDDEVVSCYKVSTGEPVWRHRDAVRFYESNGGAGPRATPTLSHGRVYTLGATGMLNALDAATGAVVWMRNAATDTGRKIPEWGIASSPLAVDDVVVVAVSGRLAAYDLATGKPRWAGPQPGGSYSSPQLATTDGV